jgi:hypothetical protein
MVVSGQNSSNSPVCHDCGNSAAHEGFYTCDVEGRRLKTSDLLCCDRCGRIVECATGKPVGHRSFAFPAPSDNLAE